MPCTKKNFRCSIPQCHHLTNQINVRTGMPNALANPKSASFNELVRRSISRFWGFKSRWRTRCEWQYAMPRRICFNILL
ncbi:Os02g0123032 [Oryza sativa Japonica Group]|uniref:Os02g0123032 protein n=1 Tax=Oryza sativa subsp. japonica TaxID=39947 RepID=A0A0P0VE37_ORYSJ|nr:hypothetical protein EE612_008553 [Oryza sativa]BAS76731.1 Os02g0123032 [Oryza sativa Japonica Group]